MDSNSARCAALAATSGAQPTAEARSAATAASYASAEFGRHVAGSASGAGSTCSATGGACANAAPRTATPGGVATFDGACPAVHTTDCGGATAAIGGAAAATNPHARSYPAAFSSHRADDLSQTQGCDS